MLSGNRNCNLANQQITQVSLALLSNGLYSGNVIFPVQAIFQQAPQIQQAYATEAFLPLKNAGKCSDNDWESEYFLLALYGMALSGAIWGFDTVKSEMSLYTCSMKTLEALASRGILKGKKQPIAIELQDIQKKLFESDRIKKSIHKGDALVAVRLDVQMNGTKTEMTCTLPRTMPKLDTTLFIPFSTMKVAYDTIYNELTTKILRVTMGDKVRDVTLNREILNSTYGVARANQLCAVLPNVYMQRLYVPNIGASKFSPGITNIKLEYIDKVEQISLADIDMSEISLDYTMVMEHFDSRIDKIPDNKLGVIAQEFGLMCPNAEPAVIREQLRGVESNMFPKDVWDIMKKYPKMFATASYMKKKSKFGSNYENIQLPIKQADLERMLDTGVYKIVLNKRSGKLSTMIVTNSTDILAKMYGDNYVAKYESDGVKARKAEKLLNEGVDQQEVYRLTGIAGMADVEVTKQDAHNRTTVVKQNHLITARSLEARDDKGYYKHIDVNSIIELTHLS